MTLRPVRFHCRGPDEPGPCELDMIDFDAAHAAVHYPRDRRFRIWIRPSIVITVLALLVLPIAAAWIEVGIWGLPYIEPLPQVNPNNFAGPHGFPLWVRYCHF